MKKLDPKMLTARDRADQLAISSAIKQSIRKAESAAVVENAIRWCSNIIVELNSVHGPNLSKEHRETLHELSLTIQRFSTSTIRSH